jgi:DNA-binding GntR family transcriptional regulator
MATRERIFVEVLRDLEEQRIVPGQRIAEADLIERFGVSRNAVREGIQLLSERGVIELSPNKSSTVRRFTREDVDGVIDLCAHMNAFLGRTAALNFTPQHAAMFNKAFAETQAAEERAEQEFARARRHFTIALLTISANKELQRVFPMAGMAIFNAQFRSAEINRLQAGIMVKLHGAVSANDAPAAEIAGRSIVENLREEFLKFF